MIETVVAGILDAARANNWEQCRARRDAALRRLLDQAADQRHASVKSLTSTIIEIDRFLRAFEHQIAAMPIGAAQKERIRVTATASFLQKRQELVSQKRSVALGRHHITD